MHSTSAGIGAFHVPEALGVANKAFGFRVLSFGVFGVFRV